MASNVTTAAETNVITTSDMVRAREIDLVQQFQHNSLAKFQQALGTTRKIAQAAGTTLYTYKTTGTLQSGEVPEGEIIPLSHYARTKTQVGSIELKKWRKATTAEAIQKSGRAEAIAETDKKLISDIQKGIRSDFFTQLATFGAAGTAVTGTGLQATLASVWGKLQVLFEDDTAQAVYFVNPEDVATYLGGATITTQNAFGMNYIEDFLGLGTVILTALVQKGTVIGTAKENIIMYYISMNGGDLPSEFSLTADSLGFIGVKSFDNYERAQAEIMAMSGVQFLVEYADGVVLGEIDDSFLTDLTVAPDSPTQTFPWTDKKPQDFQSNVAVSGGKVTGELEFIEGGLAPSGYLSGDGYFLALAFSNFASGLTYADVQVGLVPTQGAGMQTLDSDCDAVFKITDKDSQKLKVVQAKNGHKNVQYFSLKDLTLKTTGV